MKYWLAMGACAIAPNLGAFKEATVSLNSGQPLGIDWPWSVGYCLLYSASVLGLSILIFRSRNFK
ncbi:MAG: hypothetical protein BWZ10_02664 [candidate division BRC1 bacterium ADurb.BinA364]|nr:MAG: hypothetical protein BWZ10_02664 [candidate division BRC1 bacterium ADurb.BinA364]